VEFRAGRADAFRQLGLDVHVDVLERGLELEVSGDDVRLDFAQAGLDLEKLLFRQQSGRFLGAGVGDRARDVVREEPPVIGDGLAELLDERGGVFGEAAFPHGVQSGTEGQNVLDRLVAPTSIPGADGDFDAVLADLSEDHREVLMLRFVDGLSLAEIAEATGVPLGTAKSRLHHALTRLREDPKIREYFPD
jgi:hypothetical protein